MKEDREHLILLYLTGHLTAEEQDAFELWRNETDENQRMVDDFRQIWQAAGGDLESPTDFHTHQEWEKFASSVFTGEEATREKTRMFFQQS